AGTAANANGYGISNVGSWTIGGTGAGSGNVVSGNTGTGMDLHSCACTIQGNLVGTNASGTGKVANGGVGILLSGSVGGIGGTAPGAGNIISGNNGNGVVLEDASGLTVSGNRIAVGATATPI